MQTDGGPAVGTVVRGDPAARSNAGVPPADSPHRVVRLATHDDIVARAEASAARARGLPHRAAEDPRARPADEARRASSRRSTDRGWSSTSRPTRRVDFRELVRELAAEFRTRIEMRQMGVRDEAKLLGGYGTCGRPLCCTTFLTSFEPVSIKMAKQQDLSLNPSKLSGLCGRLKCCLRYELPNAKGQVHGGCGSEGGCDNPSGCGTGGVRRGRLRFVRQPARA